MSSSISTRNCSAAWPSDILPDRGRSDCGPRPADCQIWRITWHSGSCRPRVRLARPQSGYYTDIIQEAAALWESLSQNHPFLYGNKRVAVTVTAAFLKVNGYHLVFDDDEVFAFLVGLYETGTLRFQELDSWLRQHAAPDPQVEGT